MYGGREGWSLPPVKTYLPTPIPISDIDNCVFLYFSSPGSFRNLGRFVLNKITCTYYNLSFFKCSRNTNVITYEWR